MHFQPKSKGTAKMFHVKHFRRLFVGKSLAILLQSTVTLENARVSGDGDDSDDPEAGRSVPNERGAL
jgi:hypothetical protein